MDLVDRVAHFLTHQLYRVIEWFGAGVTFILFQIGVISNSPPLPSEESRTLYDIVIIILDSFVSSAVHGFMSILFTVLGFYAIHVLKRVLEDKESRAHSFTDRLVKWINRKKEND